LLPPVCFFFIFYKSFPFFGLIIILFILGFPESFLIRLYNFSVFPLLSRCTIYSQYCPNHSSLSFLTFLFTRFLSRLHSLSFLSCLCLLLCSMMVMVFSIIRDFLGCCSKFPNVFLQLLLLRLLSSPIVDLYLLSPSLFGSNFPLPYYYIFLIPFLPLVCWLSILSCWAEIGMPSFYVVIYVSWQLRYSNCIYQLPGNSLRYITISIGRSAASLMNVLQGKRSVQPACFVNSYTEFLFPTFVWIVLTMHSFWIFKNELAVYCCVRKWQEIMSTCEILCFLPLLGFEDE